MGAYKKKRVEKGEVEIFRADNSIKRDEGGCILGGNLVLSTSYN